MASVCTKYIVHVFHGWLLDGIGRYIKLGKRSVDTSLMCIYPNENIVSKLIRFTFE